MLYTNDHWKHLQLAALGRLPQSRITECVRWQDLLNGLASISIIAASFIGIAYLLTVWN